MSTFEQIYLQTNQTPAQAADTLVQAIGFDLEHNEGVLLGAHVDGIADYFGGELEVNFHADDPIEPDYEFAATDGYPLVWSVFKNGFPDEAAQMSGAKTLFLQITEKLRWPAFLTHDIQIAIAAWDPEHGLQEFPGGTSLWDEVALQHAPKTNWRQRQK